MAIFRGSMWAPRLMPHQVQTRPIGRLKLPTARHGPPLEMPDVPTSLGLPPLTPGTGGGSGGGSGGGTGTGTGPGGGTAPEGEVPVPGAQEPVPEPTERPGPGGQQGVDPTPAPPTPPTDVPPVDAVPPVDVGQPVDVPPLEPVDVSPVQTSSTPIFDIPTGEWVSPAERDRRRAEDAAGQGPTGPADTPVNIPVLPPYVEEEEEPPGVEPIRDEIPQEEIDFREELEAGGGVLEPPEVPIVIEGPPPPREDPKDDPFEQGPADRPGGGGRLEDIYTTHGPGGMLPPYAEDLSDIMGSPGGGGDRTDIIIGINPGAQDRVPQPWDEDPVDVMFPDREEGSLETQSPEQWQRQFEDIQIEAVNAAEGEATTGRDGNAELRDFLLSDPDRLTYLVDSGQVKLEGDKQGFWAGLVSNPIVRVYLGTVLSPAIGGLLGGAGFAPSATPIVDSIMGAAGTSGVGQLIGGGGGIGSSFLK